VTEPDRADGADPADGADQAGGPDLSGALEAVEGYLLGAEPTLTRVQVSEQAGVPLAVAQELWRLLGFAQQADDVVAFTEADVQALRYTHDLVRLGILGPDRQSALVRTWGRSFARLAEWQTRLLSDVALGSDDPVAQVTDLAAEVLPRVEALQSYVWRRHLASAGARLMASDAAGSDTSRLAVVFVDIVGFTSRSKELTEAELVEWIEYFEAECSGLVVDHGGRVIKNIGDEVLFVAEDVAAAADAVLTMTARGSDPEDAFPEVRGGIAYGDVVSRLGDVLGPIVNIAARLTSIARPGSVLIDRGVHDALTGDTEDHQHQDREHAGFSLRRMRRLSVKGYPRLQSWVLRRAAAEES
jgi:adenylate cyclase